MKKSRRDKHKLGNNPNEDDSIARRKRKVKKKFAIDYRGSGEYLHSIFPRKWERWNAYTTEKQRDQALRTLQRKGFYGMNFYDFRKGNNESH